MFNDILYFKMNMKFEQSGENLQISPNDVVCWDYPGGPYKTRMIFWGIL